MLKNCCKYFNNILFLILLHSAAAQPLIVESIVIDGLEKTKQKVVLREMTFSVGDSLPSENLEKILQLNENNIYNTQLFTRVDLNYEIRENRIAVNIAVKERWYIWPIPYLLLQERTFNEWWEDKDLDRAIYGLSFEWQNFSGNNDRLDIDLQGGYTREVSFEFTRPYLIPRYKIDGKFDLGYFNNKEIGYATEGGILQLARLTNEPMQISYLAKFQLSKRFTTRKRLFADLSYRYFIPHDSIEFFNPRYVTTKNGIEHYPGLTLAYVNDQRDIASFPLNGYKYALSVTQNGLPGIGTSRFTKAGANFSHYISPSRWLNFSYGNQTLWLIGNRVPYYDKVFMGFQTKIRGYERYVIDASFLTTFKMEMKVGIIPRQIVHVRQIPFRKFQDFPIGLYLSMYSDLGYATDNTFSNQDEFLKDKLLNGYGVGLSLVGIYDFLMRVEYSYNHMGESGIYIHGVIPIR